MTAVILVISAVALVLVFPMILKQQVEAVSLNLHASSA